MLKLEKVNKQNQFDSQSRVSRFSKSGTSFLELNENNNNSGIFLLTNEIINNYEI